MAKKRKKHPRLPNGYGSIRYLGSGRKNPYAVHPPGDLRGNRPQALCYVDEWMKGFIILTSYKAGTYTPGMELSLDFTIPDVEDEKKLYELADRIMADYNRIKGIVEDKGKTFKEVFLEYYKDKFKIEYEHPGKKKGMANSMSAAFKNCKPLHDKEFALLVSNDLQGVVDACPLKYSSLELITTLYKQIYFYANANNICEKDYSQFVVINKEDDDEHGVSFTDQELAVLWRNRKDPIIEMVLIMCYSGYRIESYKSMVVDLDAKSFFGGNKTEAGKERTVPIHPAILGFVRHRIELHGCLINTSTSTFRKKMYEALACIGVEKHTPHDCRHTFSRLCEKYHVQENDRKRMLGHRFDDIMNRIYGHRTLEDLAEEIEKIKLPRICDFTVTDRPYFSELNLTVPDGFEMPKSPVNKGICRVF